MSKRIKKTVIDLINKVLIIKINEKKIVWNLENYY